MATNAPLDSSPGALNGECKTETSLRRCSVQNTQQYSSCTAGVPLIRVFPDRQTSIRVYTAGRYTAQNIWDGSWRVYCCIGPDLPLRVDDTDDIRALVLDWFWRPVSSARKQATYVHRGQLAEEFQ